MKTAQQGVDLIKHFESLHDSDLKKIGLQPKMCPSGIWTVGWGRALKDIDGSWLKGVSGYQRMLDIYPDLETITKDEADLLLSEDLVKFEVQLNSLKLNLKQHEYDALISFIFNCGFGNFLSSTLLRRIKGEKGSIDDAFAMWNKSGGKIFNGLTIRRECEASLFIYGVLEF